MRSGVVSRGDMRCGSLRAEAAWLMSVAVMGMTDSRKTIIGVRLLRMLPALLAARVRVREKSGRARRPTEASFGVFRVFADVRSDRDRPFGYFILNETDINETSVPDDHDCTRCQMHLKHQLGHY